jgi:hypothetical protein
MTTKTNLSADCLDAYHLQCKGCDCPHHPTTDLYGRPLEA